MPNFIKFFQYVSNTIFLTTVFITTFFRLGQLFQELSVPLNVPKQHQTQRKLVIIFTHQLQNQTHSSLQPEKLSVLSQVSLMPLNDCQHRAILLLMGHVTISYPQFPANTVT